MTFRFSTVGLCLAVLAAPASALGGVAPVPQDLTKNELRCSRATVAGAAAYLASAFSARNACLNEVWRGGLPPTVDCRAPVDAGTGDDTTDNAIIAAESALAVAIQTKCLNVTIERLGFPGLCPDPGGPPYDSFDHEQCILEKVNAKIEALLEIEHPPLADVPLASEDLNCHETVAAKSSSMFRKEVEHRTVACEQKRLEGNLPADVNCRAELDPLDPGTGNTATDSDVVSAHNDVLRGIALACKHADLKKIGFPHRCPNVDKPLFSVAALTECMYVTHHDRLVEFIDTVLPMTRMCGDCELDGANGEQCDDGDNLWVRGQICRTNCSLITRCGDTDDSGDVTVRDALFALRAAIALETCHPSLCDVNGDGVLNTTDALVLLRSVVGLPVALACPAATDLVCPAPPEEPAP